MTILSSSSKVYQTTLSEGNRTDIIGVSVAHYELGGLTLRHEGEMRHVVIDSRENVQKKTSPKRMVAV